MIITRANLFVLFRKGLHLVTRVEIFPELKAKDLNFFKLVDCNWGTAGHFDCIHVF